MTSNSSPKRPAAPRRAPRKAASEAIAPQAAGPERIAKVMSRAGAASRRDAEKLIALGRVSVNGKIIDTPATLVGPQDVIAVDGKLLPTRERTRLFLYHKPRGLVVAARDPEGRSTIYDDLDPSLPRLQPVGRLDINTEGLLLLTNDGGLKRVLELPSTGWVRRYRVRCHGTVALEELERLKGGITVDGVRYGPIDAHLDRVQGTNSWLTVGLREGKNREVKNVLAALGLVVTRLIRISYGPFQLGEMADSAVEEVRSRILKDQLGEKLALQAGADFEAELRDEPRKRAVKPAPKTDEDGDESRRPTRKPSRRQGLSFSADRDGPEPASRGRQPRKPASKHAPSANERNKSPRGRK